MGLDAWRSVLVANRGEIACRVFRTCRRLGLRTVAVHSDADRDARHVRMADLSLRIGPAPAAESYLSIERVLDAARRAGVDAVHPGYGFLAENADFAEACKAAGFAFVGPPPEAIRAMGSKAAAKALLARAGVPVVPGYHGEDQREAVLAERAREIGYPVLVKASAGGGGKGMRAVAAPADLPAALAACRREAASSFGDARLIVEKLIERPRHVEIQVFADAHGHCVHLFERDCSLQRRHQKVVEEAPAPGVDARLRAEMGRAAIEAARAVGYVGAGTVEFILDPDGRFYFLEMNTRLQVEHPVTECVTGLDLVEWQLRIAAGEPLPRAQEAIALRGHAFEARLYAEDPDRGFVPSIGRLAHVALPAESAHVRVDSGVEAGDVISPWYDPMIAKVIVWDETREAALRRLRAALAQTRIVGVASNLAFLARVAGHEAFAAGGIDTGWVERERARLLPEPEPAPPQAWLAAALAALLDERARARTDPADPFSPWAAGDGWRLNGVLERTLRFACGDVEGEVAVAGAGDGHRMTFREEVHTVRGRRGPDDALAIEIDGLCVDTHAVAVEDRLHVFWDGRLHSFRRIDPLAAAQAAGEDHAGLYAPMPGRVVSLLVEAGAEVARGTPLLVLEAMKMEHTVTAPADGVVERFLCAEGDQIPEGAELVVFEPTPGSDASST